ncbi:hypothetical protein ACFQ0M_24755 [Kitasatospora aburaviensis]
MAGASGPGPLWQSAQSPHQAGRPRSTAAGPWAERGPGHRHRPASAPERAEAVPDRTPDRAPLQSVERPVEQQAGKPVEQSVEQQVGQSIEAGQSVLGADAAAPDTTGAGPAEDGTGTGGTALAAGSPPRRPSRPSRSSSPHAGATRRPGSCRSAPASV